MSDETKATLAMAAYFSVMAVALWAIYMAMKAGLERKK